MKPVLLIIAAALCGQFATAQDLKLWYDKPASVWTDALPIGNGKLGGMIYGDAKEEHIQFNEESLWTGEPRNYNHKGASAYLADIRRLIAEGKQEEAEKLATEQFMGSMSGEGDKELWTRQMRVLKKGRNHPASPAYDDSKWKTMQLPTLEGWEREGYDGLDGAVWFRTSFELPANWAGKNLILDLGRIRDQDFTYVNGQQIGNINDMAKSRKYTIPAALLKKGTNYIAVQVLNYFDKGGIVGYKDPRMELKILVEGDNSGEKISLNKAWKFNIQDDNAPATRRFQADYQPFGDLRLKFKQDGTVQNYRRELDLTTALATTSYSLNGVNYTREYLASAPGQLMAIHLTADKKGVLNFAASLGSVHKYAVLRKVDNETIALSVKVKNGALHGVAYLRIRTNGVVKIVNNELVVDNADDATLYLTAATNYKNFRDITANPEQMCSNVFKQLNTDTYGQVKAAHISEYQQYFNTFSLNLGGNKNNRIPTDQRLINFPNDGDPAFVALYVQYGRYLLISSSRPGSLPANLQGIWNDLLTPPWGSKYTININAEMNYWPAELLNLSPLHEPLFRMIDELVVSGSETAKEHYNAPGWVLHHNTDTWRGTAPINASNHGIWVGGAAWLCQHLWEHYLFTQDTAFLRNRAYPVMKQAAEFFVKFLVTDPKTGYLISTPSNSPEHGGLVAGPTMDHQIIRNLYNNCIEASRLLNKDEKFRDTLLDQYSRIAPNKIGKYGQLQEWMEDVDDPNDKHRHVSHLWGLHPGNEINWETTPELMRAARQSLIYRGDEGTGWSLAWKINFWARFKDGDHAYQMVKMLLTPAGRGNGGSYVNLFDAHPPFQIDGNFGGAAGIGEMLVQSHTGFIDLLPALPTALGKGEVKGICARGGFIIDMKWEDRKIQQLQITSRGGQKCTVRNGKNTISFDTEKGKTYRLNGSLQLL